MTLSEAVPAGAVASVFGNEFKYQNLRQGLAGLPQVIGIFATYDPLKTAVVPNVPVRVFTQTEAGEKFGFGFPAHLAARQTLKKSGIVPVFVFPIAETGAQATGDVTFTGPSTAAGVLSLYIGGQKVAINIASGTAATAVATAVAAAINAELNLPVTAVVNGGVPEQVDITAKYKGAISDNITIELNLTEAETDASPAGVGATITAMTGGSGVPTTIPTALAEMGTDWYTYAVNTFGTDTDIMDDFDTYNETLWDPLVNRFFRAFYGSVDDQSTITTITDARTLDRTNGAIVSTDSYALPLELAANAVGGMAASNQNNPARPYTGIILDGLLPGPVSSQWSYTERDAAVKDGCGTTILEDGVIKLEDVALHYHKTGEEPPAYRWSVDIAKLAEWAYNVKLVFEGDNWTGKILVDDNDIVSNPDARKPRDAVAEIYKLADASSFAAIITRPDITKENTTASIDVGNPNRINIVTLIVLSGATRIISLTTNFGFNFGAITA